MELSGVEWSGVEWSGVEWSGVEVCLAIAMHSRTSTKIDGRI